MNIQFFTICASNYAPQASALVESISLHHPDIPVTVWLIDDGDLPEGSAALKTRHVEECISSEYLMELQLRYNVLEFATSVKPSVFLQLFKEGVDFAIYFDPDIYLFAPVSEVLQIGEQRALGVLTPHITTPLPADGLRLNDLDVLRSGIYNLGFIAVSNCREGTRFLEWWKGWVRTNCYALETQGEFTDQKWLNFAPTVWRDFRTLFDPGYNVAYWNLHERVLAFRDGTWFANDRPLAFFHFSGFNPMQATKLSAHQNRFDVPEGSLLARMLDFYAERLLEFGARTAKALSVRPLRFSDGTLPDRYAREAILEALERGVKFSGMDGKGSVREYLQTARSMGAYPVYLETVLKYRSDVRVAMRDAPEGEILRWMHDYGVHELSLDPAFIESLGVPAPPPPPPPLSRRILMRLRGRRRA